MDNLYMILLVAGCRVTGVVSDSLLLTAFPTMATEGSVYTLVCTSSAVTAPQRTWFRGDAGVLETHYSNSTAKCDAVVVNFGVFDTYLSGRVDSATCSIFQHNVTLRMNSSVDNGTVWRCKDKNTDETSNTVTIDVINEPEAPTTDSTSTEPATTTPRNVLTPTDASTSSPTVSDTSTYTGNQLAVIYIATGVCAAVVIVIVVVIVVTFLVVLRRRNAQGKKLEFDEPRDKSMSVPSTISLPVMFSWKTWSTPDPTRYRELSVSNESR